MQSRFFVLCVFDQVIDNPGTCVQPSLLAEDVKAFLTAKVRVCPPAGLVG